MKYEAVFGDQSLFDGCYDETASIVIATSNGRKFVAGEFTEYGIVEGDVKSDGLRIAMRRIIQEPKRWTVEDKKAGRLPEVGCLVFGLDGRGECEVVASEKNELALRHVSTKNLMLVTVSAFNRNFKPLETPEEKAVRLRSEWVELAFDNMMRKEGLHSTECLDRIKCHFGSAYDALLSGALSAPTKGGE